MDAAAADAGSAPGPATVETAGGPARRRQLNLGEIVRRIWWKPAHSPFELTFVYYEIARALMPHTYRQQLAFGPAWFVHVDPSAALPQFTTGRFLRSPPGTDLGPFATQADAARFVEILQDTFDLCRYHHILEQAPHGQACAYFEMGRCPAPCDGTISLDRYRGMIADALRFACGQRHDAYQRIDFAMRDAAANRRYEQAGILKKQLERARGIEHVAFARAAPIEAFTFLVLQRGAGTTALKPFFIRQGVISAALPVKRCGIREALVQWRQELSRSPEPANREQRSEHIWLMSHFLFKPDPPGLYLGIRELSDEAPVLQKVEERFGRRVRPAARPQDEFELKGSADSSPQGAG